MSLYWPAEKEAWNPLDSPVALVVSLTNKTPLLEMTLLGRTLPVNPDPVCTGEPEVVLPRKTWKITHLQSPKQYISWKERSLHKCYRIALMFRGFWKFWICGMVSLGFQLLIYFQCYKIVTIKFEVLSKQISQYT